MSSLLGDLTERDFYGLAHDASEEELERAWRRSQGIPEDASEAEADAFMFERERRDMCKVLDLPEDAEFTELATRFQEKYKRSLLVELKLPEDSTDMELIRKKFGVSLLHIWTSWGEDA